MHTPISEEPPMATVSPQAPGAAFDKFLRDVAPAARQRSQWTPAFGPMPAVFLSHGAPPLFDDAEWIAELFAWAQSWPQPTGIVIISAHWEAAPPALSATGARTPLVYDFGGFAQRYYTMTYPTPDAGALAAQVRATMPDGESIHQHPSRGLDHGAWVPLKVMFPAANIPVVQLSLPHDSPTRLLDLGSRLRPLRDEGVLVIGSGFTTHGLPYLTRDMFVHNQPASWSRDFDAWAASALAHHDLDALANFRSAPGMPYAHPTVEHFTPMFITLGAADPADRITTAIDGFAMGLAKRSFEVA